MYDIRTYGFAWKNKQAQQYSDGTNNRSCECCNTDKQKAIYRSRDQRVTRIDAEPKAFSDARHLERRDGSVRRGVTTSQDEQLHTQQNACKLGRGSRSRRCESH
jgi:hypothetical protein